MKSYTFRAAVEKDTFPDGTTGYFVYVPESERLGVATRGRKPSEASKNLQDVLEMIVKEFIEEKRSMPAEL